VLTANNEAGAVAPSHFKDRTAEIWQSLASQMTSFNNPYFELLTTMADQFSIFKDEPQAPLPSWVKLVKDFKERKIKAESAGQEKESLGDTGMKGVDAKKKKLEKSLVFFEKMKEGAEKAMGRELPAVEELTNFQTTLRELSPVMNSKDQAYQFAAQLFKTESRGS
jgi:hypothetical protein